MTPKSNHDEDAQEQARDVSLSILETVRYELHIVGTATGSRVNSC